MFYTNKTEALQSPASVLNDGQQQQEHHHADQALEEPVYTRLLTDYGNIRNTGSRENTTLKSILKQDSFRVSMRLLRIY